MIVIKNRELLIPNNEQFIGTVYDNNADTRFFKIDRVLPGQIDLNNFTFVADVKYSNNATDSLSLTKETVTDDSIVLRMSLPASVLSSHVGNMAIQVRCSDTAGRTWSTAPANMYIMDQISNPGAVVSSTTLTELQQTETTIEASEALRIAAENARVTAEGAAEPKSGRVGAEIDRVAAETLRIAAETSRASAETGRTSAETGRANAETARVSAETGRASAETGRVNAESARVIAEASRVSAEATRAAEFDEKSLESEGWAKGTQNDVPVSSGSPYYHNNSKYYKEQADAESLEAEGWAKGTQNGVEVGSSSPYYHDNSKYYKEQAGQATVGFVSYAVEQDLNDTAKARARGNIDAYTKPASGIPSSDMTSAVQTSLGKADTALQEHQSLAAYQQKTDSDLTTTAQTVVGAINEHETDLGQLNLNKADRVDVHSLINVWDEQWELGYINITTGVDANSSDYARSVGYIKVKPSTEYYSYCNAANTGVILFYSDTKSYLSYSSARDTTFTTPSNCSYIRFYFTASKITEVSINFPSTYTGYYPSALPRTNAHLSGLGNAVGMRGWNQLVGTLNNAGEAQNVTKTYNASNNEITCTPTNYSSNNVGFYSLNATSVVVGHKYLVSTNIKAEKIVRVRTGVGGAIKRDVISANAYTTIANIETATTNGTFAVYVELADYGWTTEKFYLKNLMCIDLTALFGAGNEPSSVSDFMAMFPADYYPYCSGSFGDLLWTNASPAASFPSQNVSIDFSGYSFLLIIGLYKTSTVTRGSVLVPTEQSVPSTLFIIDFDTNARTTRKMILGSNYISFAAGYTITTTATSDNNSAIPYKIYGIR